MRLDLTPPKGWSILPLSRIITGLRGGVSVNGTDLPARNGEPGVLKLSAISYGQFAPEQNKAVIENERSRLGPSVRGNTILISRSNTTELVGACVYVSEDFPHLYLPDLIWEIEVDPSNGNSAKWLSYMLSSGAVRASLMARATGTSGSMKKLSMAALRVMQIWQPPLPEQERIAEIITTWDTAIAQTAKLLEARRKLKKGLMQQLLTGKRRFPEFNNLWKEARLEDMCKIVYGKSQNAIVSEDGPYPIWGTGGIVGYAEEYLYDKPSVILGRKGTIDRPTMSAKPFWAIDTTFYTEIKDGIDPQWLYQRFLLIPWRKYNEASGVPSLSRETIYKIRIDVPDTEEQRKIAAVLNEVDRQIESLVRLSKNFEEQKRGLMQKLLTGQIRVKTTEEITA